MHEYSIVQSLIDTCETYAQEHHATKITKVVIKIGKFSGVEPHLLEVAFETFKEKTVCDECELIMEIHPFVITCRACQKRSTLEYPHSVCPGCESTDVIVEDGEDMYLMSLEMEN